MENWTPEFMLTENVRQKNQLLITVSVMNLLNSVGQILA